MHEVDRYGIATVVERAIESINPRFVFYYYHSVKLIRKKDFT
jgi:hypothetical protein